MDVAFLFLSLAVLTVGAEALVRGASVLALRAGLSPLFVGLTVVGFGTSSPELGASLTATMAGSSDVSVGNVVGSNIFNIGLILGITAIVRPIRVRFAALRRDLRVAIAAAVVPWTSLAFGQVLPRGVGIALVATLAAYLTIAYRAARRSGEDDLARREVEGTLLIAPEGRRFRDRPVVAAGLVLGGLALLVAGSRGFVFSAIELARHVGMSELAIGLTIVSAGTSMPELVTSIVAARRNSPDLAIGNVIGSGIFNVFGILGVCSVVRPQVVSGEVLAVHTPVMLLATLALVPFVKTGGSISRVEGAMLLAGYGAYLTFVLASGH